jgi:hypothetical protein
LPGLQLDELAGDAIYAFLAGTGDLGTVADFLSMAFGDIGYLLTDAIGVLYNYATVWIDLGETIAGVVGALLSGDLAGAWQVLTSGIAQVVADYQVYAASLGALLYNLGTTIVTAVATYGPLLYQAFLTWGQALVDWVTPYAALALQTLDTWIAGLWTWVQLQVPLWIAQLGAWGQALVDWIAPYLPIVLTTLGTWISGIWGWVQEQVPIWLAQLMSWGQSLVDWVAPFIPPALEALGSLATSIFGWIGEQAAPLVEKFGTWAQSIVDWIPGATVDFLAAWPGMFDQFLSWIGEQAGPLLEKLGDWGLQFVEWVAPKIPDILVAVAGIAAAILVWVGETALTLANKLIEWGPPFYDWVHAEAIPKLLTALGEMGGNIVGWITDTIKTAGDEVVENQEVLAALTEFSKEALLNEGDNGIGQRDIEVVFKKALELAQSPGHSNTLTPVEIKDAFRLTLHENQFQKERPEYAKWLELAERIAAELILPKLMNDVNSIIANDTNKVRSIYDAVTSEISHLAQDSKATHHTKAKGDIPTAINFERLAEIKKAFRKRWGDDLNPPDLQAYVANLALQNTDGSPLPMWIKLEKAISDWLMSQNLKTNSYQSLLDFMQGRSVATETQTAGQKILSNLERFGYNERSFVQALRFLVEHVNKHDKK